MTVLKDMTKLLILIECSLAIPMAQAFNLPASYEATYSVSRGGKAMAKQTTTYLSLPSQHTLSDTTEGTHGLASFTGFKRNETTNFEIAGDKVTAIEHKMRQKVAFKKKSYQFKLSAKENIINGKNKKPFTLQTDIKPISSHMLPLWLSAQVCKKSVSSLKNISIPVLKSKKIKTYDFNVFAEANHLVRVERIYPKTVQKSSHIWLNTKQNCIPVKTLHKETGEPMIETKLLTHNLITKPNK